MNWNRQIKWIFLLTLIGVFFTQTAPGQQQVVFQKSTPYHNIQVIDVQGARFLSFDGSMETRMLLINPLQGHFLYTEYFHLPWLWNPAMTNVLMIGLGGGSVQRAYLHYYTNVQIDTVEIDPEVIGVAKNFFNLPESPRHQIYTGDGRVYLRRTPKQYGAIIIDAYASNRYGSFIPYHLVTLEFFQLVDERLNENGVVAYNVMGTIDGWRSDIVGAVYRTMRNVFPQVYLFPAPDSQNVVLIGTKSGQLLSLNDLNQRAMWLIRQGRVTMPNYLTRLQAYRYTPPMTAYAARVLTDDFAPVDGLLGGPGIRLEPFQQVPPAAPVQPQRPQQSIQVPPRW